jgi:hypothetical protein
MFWLNIFLFRRMFGRYVMSWQCSKLGGGLAVKPKLKMTVMKTKPVIMEMLPKCDGEIFE